MPVHDAVPRAEQDAPPPPGADPAVPEPASDRSHGRQLIGQAGRLLGRIPRHWRLPLATFLACQVLFLFWWAAFYPALMSYDSVAYVMQVTTGPWVNNYSILYDALVWLSLHLTGGLAALALAQTTAMSAAFGYTVAAFRRLGIPGRWTAAAAVVATALPPTGTFVIFIWKDVAFVICLYFMVPTMAHLLSLRGVDNWRRDRRVNLLIAALGLELLGVMLFRLNGFVVVAITVALLLVLLRGIRVRLTAAAAAAACVAYLLNFLIYPALGVQKTPGWEAYFTEYADIAVAYAERPWSFTPTDLRLMAQAAPLAKWKQTANCYDADPTTRILGPAAHSQPLSGQLAGVWLRVLKRSPDLVLGARICRGSITWSIFPGPASNPAAQTVMDPVSIDSNLFGLGSRKALRDSPYRDAMVTRPLSGGLNSVALFLRSVSNTSQFNWLLWRGAFWCYMSYVAVWLFARRRRDWALLSLGAIVAGQQLGTMVDVPAQLFRYMTGTIFIGIVLVPLLFARNRPVPPDGGPA